MDTLDVVKFICKDLWVILFKKQIDNLKTNHRVSEHERKEDGFIFKKIAFYKGVYVLQDNGFRWFMRMSTDIGGTDSAKKAMPVSQKRSLSI